MKKFNADFVVYGLEKKVFLAMDVMQLLYDKIFSDYNYKTSQTHYTWIPSPFDKVPIACRKQIVTALIHDPELYQISSDLRDEFYTRINCALHLLLDEYTSEADVTDGMSTTYSYEGCFDAISTITLVKEFNNWHKWGLPVSLAERELLHKCLHKFLDNHQIRSHHLSNAIAEKKAELYKEIRKYKNKLSRLRKKMSALNEKYATDEAAQAESSRFYHECWLPTADEQYELEEQLALAETYVILTANYPVMDELLVSK